VLLFSLLVCVAHVASQATLPTGTVFSSAPVETLAPPVTQPSTEVAQPVVDTPAEVVTQPPVVVDTPVVTPPTPTTPPTVPAETAPVPTTPAEVVPLEPVPTDVPVVTPQKPQPPTPTSTTQGGCVQGPLGRVRAGSIYARSLQAAGAPTVPCTAPAQSGCVSGPLGTVRAGSAYARTLVAGGARVVPCPNTNSPRPAYTRPTTPPTGGCVQGPLGRVRAGSIYARSLQAAGAAVVPCTGTTPATRPVAQPVARPPVPNARGAVLCDSVTGRRALGGSIYAASLQARGRLVACAARAESADASVMQQQSSGSSETPAWAVALIVVGSLVIVFLVAVMVQVFALLRRSA
jgi:hypothetical protein